MRLLTSILMISLIAVSATAQLAVTVLPPKITAEKAVVQLTIKNNLGETVQSARAMCFLLDEQGKMVGQSTKWVIGQNHTNLAPKAEATFNFVVTSPQPWTTTNLTARISFSRVVLDGGNLADVHEAVNLIEAGQGK